MKVFVISVLTAFVLSACSSAEVKTNQESAAEAVPQVDSVVTESITDNDTTPRITGIGGIFYETENPFKTREWYNKHLNLSIDEWGAVFEFRNANNKEQINYLRWGPAQKGAGDFYPTKSNLMINYRVNNIEGMIRNLRSAGVIFVDNIQEFDYGKFIHFIDLDSNKVELWEPNDAALTKLAGKTNK